MVEPVDIPNFAGDRAGAIVERQRAYQKNQRSIEKAKASMKSEIDSIKNRYEGYINRLEENNDEIKAELYGFIDVDAGETSVTTSLGNVQARLTKSSWKWPSASKMRSIAKHLPVSYVKTKQVIEVDKDKLKKACVVHNGRAYFKDTGELVDNNIVITPGGQPTVTIRPNKGAE